MSRQIATMFAAIALTALSTTPASAEPGHRTVSERISYADLDLSSADGVKTLKTRLNAALDRVCGRSFDSVSVAMRRLAKACRTNAMDQAMASVKAPLRTAENVTVEASRFGQR